MNWHTAVHPVSHGYYCVMRFDGPLKQYHLDDKGGIEHFNTRADADAMVLRLSRTTCGWIVKEDAINIDDYLIS